MRGDMGGAACVMGALHTIARLQIPANVSVLVPMAENMPSDRAAKPGDVFTAMNGKTVEVRYPLCVIKRLVIFTCQNKLVSLYHEFIS